MNVNLKKIAIIITVCSFSLILSIGADAAHSKMENTTLKQEQKKGKKIKIEHPKKANIWDIYPDLNKNDFAPQLEVDTEIVEANIQDDANIQIFPGFYGSYSTDEVEGNTVKILEDSLNVTTHGLWSVIGLVRNEMVTNANKAIVEAVLFNMDGQIIDTASSDVMVQNLRPGEPAPFTIDSNVSTEDVSKVEWTVLVKDKDETVYRDQTISIYYELPLGEDTYKNSKRDDAPYPFVLSAGFNNLGKKVSKETLTVAWLSPEGKVVWIEETSLEDGFAKGVEEGGSANFNDIVVDSNDTDFANKLHELSYLLWTEGK